MSEHHRIEAEIEALKAFDAACDDLLYEPAYVFLRDGKGPFQKRWPELRPSLEGCVDHLESGGQVGVQPGSLQAVVFDSDKGSGPEAAKAWIEDLGALAASTPSTSGDPLKGHVWARVESYTNSEIKNGHFAVTHGLDDSIGDVKGWGGQVRLTAASMARLTEAMLSGHFAEGARMEAQDVTPAYTSGSAVVDPDFDPKAGEELTEAELPADLLERLEDPKLPQRHRELHAILGRLKAIGYSYDSCTEVLRPFVQAWPPHDGKYDGDEFDRHCAESWAKLSGPTDPADDFPNDLPDAVRTAAASDERPPKRRRFLDFFALQEMKDPEWLVEGMVPVGSLGSIVGESQTFKTFFALRLGLSLAVGADPFEGHGPDERLPTQLFFIAGEGAETLKHRVTAALVDLNVNPSMGGEDGRWEGSPPIRFQPMPTPVDDDAEFEKLMRDIRRDRLKDHRVLIMVDTLSQNFTGDENSTQDMRRFVRNLDRLKRALRAPVGDGREEDATVCFIHHLGKDRSKGARGSSLLLADVDFQITLTRSKEPLTSDVVVTKQKAAATGPVGTLRMRQSGDMGMEATLVCDPKLGIVKAATSEKLVRQAWIEEAYEPDIRRTDLIDLAVDEFGVSKSTAGRDVDKFVRNHRELEVNTGPNNSKIIRGRLTPDGP